MAKFCWEIRGCEENIDISDHCPHYELGGRCPIDCQFANCYRPTHKRATDIALLLDPDVDRSAAIRERCCVCEFFIKNGPRLHPSPQAEDPN